MERKLSQNMAESEAELTRSIPIEAEADPGPVEVSIFFGICACVKY